MVFWVGILAGGFFVWFAVKIGFYETWTMLFNIVISIYAAVFLTPVIIENVPAASDTSYGTALTLAAIAAGVFLILYGISYTFLTSQFSVSFPKIFDNLGAGVLGFLSGLLIWSFLVLLISTMPIAQNSFVRDIGFGPKIEQTSGPYISWWCNLVNKAVASGQGECTAQQVIGRLLEDTQDKPLDKTPDPAEQGDL